MQDTSSSAIIFSGASGAGKTTLAQYLLKHNASLQFSISACTRPRRPYEVDGQDYHFLSQAEFEKRTAQGAFLEWEEVYPNHYYGTLKQDVEKLWATDRVVLFDVDVRGGLKLKSKLTHRALAIFVQAPSTAVLAERLQLRGESAESVAMRTNKASQEMALAAQFDAVLINRDLEDSCRQVQGLVEHFLTCRLPT